MSSFFKKKEKQSTNTSKRYINHTIYVVASVYVVVSDLYFFQNIAF